MKRVESEGVGCFPVAQRQAKDDERRLKAINARRSNLAKSGAGLATALVSRRRLPAPSWNQQGRRFRRLLCATTQCTALALASGNGMAVASPKLLDLDGTGFEAAVMRHEHGAWRAYRRGMGPPLSLAMTKKTRWHWAASGDFNGDGRDEALLRRNDGAWVYYPFDGGRVLNDGRRRAILTRQPDWRPAGIGDLNGDGRDDVLLRRDDGAWAYYPMDGHRVIAAERGWANLPRNPDWRLAGVGDFDGDGRDDVLLRHAAGAWRLYPMDGRRIVSRRVQQPHFVHTLAWRFVAAADFDADGRYEVLLRHIDGRWRYQSWTGSAVVTASPALPNDWAWRLAAVGDLDGDGADDVLLRHLDGGWRSYTELRNRPVAAEPTLPRVAWRIAAPPVHLPNPALRAAVRAALGLPEGVPVSRRALANLQTLEVYGADVTDLAGIGLATGLRTLGTGGLRGRSVGRECVHWWTRPEEAIEDVSELAGLVQLRTLVLAGNRIADVSPLSGLAALEHLDLAHNYRITDIAPLAALGRLNALSLGWNQVTDLKPLAELRSLRLLGICHNEIEDLAPLAGLTELRALSASGNYAVSDISALARMTEMLNLDIGGPFGVNSISDISPLARLTNLEELGLTGSQVSDLRPLAGLTSLRRINMQFNRIEDVTPLANLTNLHWLALHGNRIADVSALSGLKNLTLLRLSDNAISELSPLAGMTKLRELGLEDNSISDLSPLAGMSQLRELRLNNNAISDISAIANLGNLQTLTLGRNDIVDIRALGFATELVELDLSYNRIADISPLAALTKLVRLTLPHNEVVAVHALEFLTELKTLDLSYNRIADISPLLANEGLGHDDEVDLRGNPLRQSGDAIVALGERGVAVQVHPTVPPRLEGVHNDNVVVLHVGENIATETAFTSMRLDVYASYFYSEFADDFDFLIFLSNLNDIRDHENARYRGLHYHVSNNVEGTGLRRFYDNRYGSRERLKGVMHFPYNDALANGPSLHEIMHAWANFAVPTANGGHWGFSSANGQLGGFDLANLENLGDGQFAAGEVAPSGWAINHRPYGPVELYLAGYLPPEEVPDLWVAEDGEWVVDENGWRATTEAGNPIFRAQKVDTYTVDDIVEDNGERVPVMAQAQWNFRAALVLLTDDNHPATQDQLDTLSEHAVWFSQRRFDASRLHDVFHEERLYNFHEATRGRGSITFDDLASRRRVLPGPSTGLPASYGRVPKPHASLLDGRCVVVSSRELTRSPPRSGD